jgi:hypothetical protein
MPASLDDDKKILAGFVTTSTNAIDDIQQAVSPAKLAELMEKIVDARLDAKLATAMDARLDAKLATAMDARLDAKLATAMDALRVEFIASLEPQGLKLDALFTRADEMQASLVGLAAKSGEMQASLDGLTPLIARADEMQASLVGLIARADEMQASLVGLIARADEMQVDLELVTPDALEAAFDVKFAALDAKLTGQIVSLGVADVNTWLAEQKALFTSQMQASSDLMTKHGKDVDSLKADVGQWTAEHGKRFDDNFTGFSSPYFAKISEIEARGAVKIQELESLLVKQAEQYAQAKRSAGVNKLVNDTVQLAMASVQTKIQLLTDTTASCSLQLVPLSDDLYALAKSSLCSCYLKAKLDADKFQAVMSAVQALTPATVNAVTVHQLCMGMRVTLPVYDTTLTEKLKSDGPAGLSEENIFAAIPRDQSWDDLATVFEHADFNAKSLKFFETIVLMAGHLPEIFPLS